MVGATQRFSELVLLLDGADCRIAHFAGEVTDQKLWLDLSRARDSALNRHHASETAGFQFADFINLGQVVDRQ